MTEKELEETRKAVDANYGPFRHVDTNKYKVLIQADIARQLTRIADKLDERWDFNKEADDLATEVNTQLERKPTPPDALVEAVKTVLKDIDNILKNNSRHYPEGSMRLWQVRLEETLAAHEKAVTK